MLLPGRLLKQARLSAGLTQAQLAGRLRTSQPAIARLESGRSNPRVSTLRDAIAATGHELEIELVRAGYPTVDETLIVGNLRLTPGERLRKFSGAYRGARSFAGAALRGSGP